jgi:hypothetical protein
MHTVTPNDTLIISRPEYLAVFFKADSPEYKDKDTLYRELNGLSPLDSRIFSKLLEKYEVRYLVLNADDKNGIIFVENRGYPLGYKNPQYKIYIVESGSTLSS